MDYSQEPRQNAIVKKERDWTILERCIVCRVLRECRILEIYMFLIYDLCRKADYLKVTITVGTICAIYQSDLHNIYTIHLTIYLTIYINNIFTIICLQGEISTMKIYY